MRYLMITALLFILFSMPAYADEAADMSTPESVEVAKAFDVDDIIQLSFKTSKMLSTISKCMLAGQQEDVCYCDNMDTVNQHQKVLKNTLKTHPEWEGKQVTFTDPQGMGMTVSFVGYQQQTEQIDALSCETK
ncbi:MAG: hypothetical protein VX740_09870 [Pseudomonadota bacterium]|nr:hypothetical protein [Alphaproteobacteria bacterium]MEC7701380.1 hypothetical protein [Pseudomonadota bacterium]MEC9235567.1 hypothetical protein [Pseudomonadota bacterium]MED5423731.1 hypothetical protein [Pseudomonadota bacterium]